MRLKVDDANEMIANLDLPAYHMSTAEVQLLTPQVLLATVRQSARGTITTTDLILCLGNEVELQAHYSPCSNLLLLNFYNQTPAQKNF